MNILNNIQDINTQSTVNTNEKNSVVNNQKTVKTSEYKPDILDIFSEKVVNKNDINDMVTTPRAIFKGYLCFTVGTTLNTIGSLIKQGKTATAVKIAGCIASIYGTYNFVKPYLVKNDNLTKTEK